MRAFIPSETALVLGGGGAKGAYGDFFRRLGVLL